MSPLRTVVACAVLLWASSVIAECTPEGRATFSAGLQALNRGDMAAAASYFGDLVKSQPDCAEARNNLAAVLVEQGRLDDAVEQLRHALQSKPDYERARLNLQRVQDMQAARAPQPPGAQPKIEVSAAPPAAPVGVAVPPVQTQPIEAHAPVAQPAASGGVPGVGALEPAGATACGLDVGQNRICVYRRMPDGIVSDACYPIAAVRVRAWPQWVTASDLNARRIRLVDETGVKRLKIVPQNRAGGADEVRLAPEDFAALSGKVVPWRTGWVVIQAEAPLSTPDSATVAALKEAVERWRLAWKHKQFDDYVHQYSRSFEPQSDTNLERWRARKQRVFEGSGTIAVQLSAPNIFVLGQQGITTFEQSYRSDATTAHDFKALRWQREGDGWKIGAETVLQEGQ